jgi:CheY-like chemotaxis protein
MDVLVVDDEPLVREIVAESLYDDGLRVTEAASAEQALEIAGDRGAPDVLVTDVNLGQGMDGLQLAEEVRRRWPSAGVVIMTGNPAYVGDRGFKDSERSSPSPSARRAWSPRCGT